MYRVTRKQLIRQGGNVIEFEDSFPGIKSAQIAESLRHQFVSDEIFFGGQSYGPDKVIFESPTFYRSVQVTIEEIQ